MIGRKWARKRGTALAPAVEIDRLATQEILRVLSIAHRRPDDLVHGVQDHVRAHNYIDVPTARIASIIDALILDGKIRRVSCANGMASCRCCAGGQDATCDNDARPVLATHTDALNAPVAHSAYRLLEVRLAKYDAPPMARGAFLAELCEAGGYSPGDAASALAVLVEWGIVRVDPQGIISFNPAGSGSGGGHVPHADAAECAVPARGGRRRTGGVGRK